MADQGMPVSTGKADSVTAARNEKRLRALFAAENTRCADCLLPLTFDNAWASVSLGVWMCIQCSGVHRSMGTHISKVRAVKADCWNDDWVDNLQRWGNERAVGFWEAHLDQSQRPAPNNGVHNDVARRAVLDFIKAKYEKRVFAADGEPGAWHECLPLANGWSRQFDAESNSFYYSDAGGETTWDLPEAARQPGAEARRWWGGCEGWLEKKSGGKEDKSKMKMMQKWDRRYFVLDSCGTSLSYYKSAEGYRKGEAPAGSVECAGSRAFLKEVVGGKGGADVYRFTVASKERELKLRGGEADYKQWQEALRPAGVSFVNFASE